MRGRSAAWIISALAHALLVVALYRWRLPPRPTLPAPDPWIDVAIDIRPRGAPPPGPRPPSATLQVRPRPKSGPSAMPAAAARDEDPRPSAGPVEAPLDLSLQALSRDAQDRIAGPPPVAALAARPHRLSVDEMRAEAERAEVAAANVRAGRVDPLLYDYLRGARARFEAEARRQADAIAMGPGETVRSWGRGYLARVDEAHRGVGNDARAAADPAERRPDLLGGYGEATRQPGAVERRLEICLDVAPGRETRAALRRASGNAALDRVALAAFTDAAAARPVPPDARTGHACYEVRIAAERAPPLPFVSCGFDSTGFTCIWPFKKITSVSGRLVSVDYPARTARSLLRPPR